MVTLGQKLKNAKNIRKPILQDLYTYCVQKMLEEKVKYLRKETILKIGHLAKAI